MASQQVSHAISKRILEKNRDYSYADLEEQLDAKSKIKSDRGDFYTDSAVRVRSRLSPSLQSKEKGASNWLTVIPIEEHGFTLHKGAFRDALTL